MENETGRLEAFSDGVFAVAITLLALNLKVPTLDEVAGRTLWTVLNSQWPTVTAFVTSFITILIVWLNHHSVLKEINRNDGKFMLLNGLMLLFVTIVPFTTSTVATHFGHPSGSQAIVLYNGNFFCLAISFWSTWRYAVSNGRLLDERSNKTKVKRVNGPFKTGLILYGIAFMCSFFFTLGAFVLSVLLAAYFASVGIGSARPIE